MNGPANALISSAAAENVLHRRVDILIAGVGILLQQGDRVHDLSGLAVTALGHMFVQPGFLDGMVAVLGETFDGQDDTPRGL